MARFRIGHISDLHLSRVTDRGNPIEGAYQHGYRATINAALQESKRSLRLRGVAYPSTFHRDVALKLLHVLAEDFSDNLNALIVSGDVATTGSSDDLGIARNYFEGKIPASWNYIDSPPSLRDSLPYPIVFVPGNHDRYHTGLSLPGSASFERHFGLLWDLDSEHTYVIPNSCNRVRFLCIEEAGQIEKPNGLIFGMADFSLQSATDGVGKKGWFGQGRVYKEILDELMAGTHEAISESRRQGTHLTPIWVFHFPPEYPGIDQELKLIDDHTIAVAAAQCGVKLILSGHTHHAKTYSIPKSFSPGRRGRKVRTTLVSCCSSTTGYGCNNCAFSIIDIVTNRGRPPRIEREDYVYDFGVNSRDFFPSSNSSWSRA